LNALGNLEANTQLLNSHSQSIAKLETQIGQLANSLNRRAEVKLPSQPIANPKGQHMPDGNASSSSHHEQVQAIIVLRSGRVVDNKVEERKDEQTGPPKKPNLANDKGVSNEVPSSATPTFETPNEPKAPFPEHLKEPSYFSKQ
jgi:hypothetical protein